MPGPIRTQIADTLYSPEGATLNGKIVVSTTASWTSADGFLMLQGFSIWVPVVNGVLDISLVPNEGSNPASTYSVAMQMTDGYFEQTWNVPSSSTPVNLAAVVVS
jgi:hypothetical protein